MKRLVHLLAVFAGVVGGCSMIRAQGTVNFANVGGGVNAPVSRSDGLLVGDGYFAQLQLVDGTNVGDPAPFLGDGLFADGPRTIDGVEGGATVDLQIAVSDSDGSVAGVSEVISVILGGGGTPPSPPVALTGLRPFEVQRPSYYGWTRPFFDPQGVICELLGTGLLAILPVDDCYCAHLPFPEGVTPVRTPVPCGDETNGGVVITRQTNGSLELRWPIGRSLIRGRQLDGGRREYVSATRNENGSQVRSFRTVGSKFFFWLE